MPVEESSSGESRGRFARSRKALLALAATAGLLFLAAHLPQVRRAVLGYLAETVRETPGLILEAEELDYNLAVLRFELKGISLRVAGAEDLPPLAEARRASLDFGLWSLLFGEVRLEDGLVEGLEVEIVTDAEGRSNLPETGGNDSSAAPTLAVESFRASGPALAYRDESQGIEVWVPEWSASVSGPDALHASFSSQGAGAVAWEGRTLEIGALALELAGDASRLEIERATASVGGVQLEAVGGLQDPLGELVLDVAARATGGVSQLARLAGVESPIEGGLALDVRFTDALERLRVNATGDLAGWVYGTLPAADSHFEAGWTRGEDVAELDVFSITAPYGQMAASGRAALTAAGGETELELSWSDVRLARLAQEVGVEVLLEAKATGGGTVHFPALQWERVEANLSTTLQPTLDKATPGRIPVAGSFSISGGLGNAVLSTDGLEALGTNAAGVARVGPGEAIAAQFAVTVEDAGDAVAEVESWLGRAASGDLGGAAVGSVELAGTLSAPVVDVRLDSEDLRLGGLENVALSLNTGATAQVVDLRGLRIAWEEQTFEASGQMGLEGESPSLDIATDLHAVDISQVLKALGSDLRVSGGADATARISGTVAAPEATFSATASNLIAYEEPLGALTAEGTFSGGRLELASAELVRDEQAALSANGWWEVDSGALEFNLGGPGLTLTRLRPRPEQVLTGVLKIEAKGTGTLDAPQIEWSVAGDELKLDDFSIGALELVGDLDAGVASARFTAPDWELSGDAEASMDGDTLASLEARISGLDLERLNYEFREGAPLTGVVSASLRGEGPIGQWNAWRGTATIDEFGAQAAGQRVATDGPARLSYADGVMEVERLRVSSGESALAVSGSLPTEAEQDGLELRLAGGLDLSPLPLLLGRTYDEAFADGVLELDGVVRGRVDAPRPELDVRLEGGTLFLPETMRPMLDIDLAASISPDRMTLDEFGAEWAQARITASGAAAAEEALQLKGTVTGLNLGALEAASEDLEGMLDLEFEATASELSLAASSAKATATRLELRYRDLELAQQRPTEITLRNSVLEIGALDWKGTQLSLTAAGRAALEEGGEWDLRFDGSGDAGISTLLLDDVVAAGPFAVKGRIAGALADPELSGTFELGDGRVSFDDYGLDAVGLNAKLAMSDDRFSIEQFAGEFNGGTLEASGQFQWNGGQAEGVDLALTTRDVYMDFPDGLRTVSRADLRAWSTDDDQVMVGGEVVVEDGSMRERLDLESEVLTFLGSDGLELPGERAPLLARIRYNVGLRTDNPILVDNNLAQLEAEANLRLVGTYYRPALVGRMTLDEGGEVYLAENDYVIERGAVDFTSETRLRPSLNLTARTQVSGHEITLRALGSPDELDTQFTSDTGLSEPDILSLLLTGRTLEQAQEAGFNVAREQALSYLTGRLGGRLSGAAERGLGLSRVRIEPNLIAAEENPTARLTVGQQLTRRLELIYSMDLTDSSDQIIVTEYDVTRMFSTRAVRNPDNEYRFDFRHDMRFGLGDQRPARKARTEKRIGRITLAGDLRMSEASVRERIDLEEGDRYDFFKARKQVDRLLKLYHADDRLEARVRLRREETSGAVDLRYEIDGGPRVELLYEGAYPPSGIREEVRSLWARGVFGEQRARDARMRVLRWLDDERRLAATVRTAITDRGDNERRVLVEIQPGARFNELELTFSGNDAIPDEDLILVLEQTALLDRLRTEQREAASTLKRYYALKGRLDANVETPVIALDEGSGEARATIVIHEGALYRVGTLTFTGARAIHEDDLRKATTPTEETRAYEPRFLDEALQNIENLYWDRGYNDVLVEFRLTRVKDDPRVDIEFVLTENKQDIVKEITVAGNRKVSEKLIERRLLAEEDKPLLNEQSDKSRRRLYDTGAFALVDLESESIPGIEAAPGVDAVKLTATVREVSPFKVRYGGFFDTERGPGFIADFENRNSLGAARVAGVRARYDADFREARAYFSQPLMIGRPINSTAALFRSRELRESFITDRTGVSLQQEIQFNRKWLLNYGWRFERAHTFDRNPEDVFIPFDQTIDIAPLQTTLSFDSRDALLDATRGRFFSNALEFAPASLGSDVRFVKYFGQYFEYQSFLRPKEDPFRRTQRRPRLIWASGVRAGLQEGLGGQDIVFSERFFAGGGTTIRGFRQDRVGPKDFFGDAAGGEAVFVVNQEARFPVIGPFEGVGFLDVGNVYERWDDFSLSDLRKAAGIGLRVRTPFFLLRVDYGLKLDRRDGEPRGAVFFSIGQAF